MAKGFTVKAASTNKPVEEWDFEEIKQKMRGKNIIFCLPGRGCSYNFLKSFLQLCFDLAQNGMGFAVQQDYSSMVNFARCKVLGANVLRGKWQKPWNGQLNYDYQLWIDSDIMFDSNAFWKLCALALKGDETVELNPEYSSYTDEQLYEMDDENEEVRRERVRRLNRNGSPIVSGWYATEDGTTTSTAHWLEAEDFKNNGGVMNHETVESMSKRRKPFTVDYIGGGWMMIQKGVFENLPYPWFGPKLQVFPNGIQDFCGEDVSFCLDAKEIGFKIIVDPRIRVGHEKTRVI